MAPAVPIVGLGAGLLFFRLKWCEYAYASSLLLLFSFTIYVALIYFGYFPKRPCACVGLFEKMSWGQHLIVNTSLSIIEFSALTLHLKRKEVSGTA